MKNKLLFQEELQNRATVFVACSGGIDSMVLVHLLKSLSLPITVLHCNFQLRGKDSDDDQIFIQTYCANQNIPFLHKRFDTKSHLKNHNQSIQELARNLRYAWFEEIQQNHPNALICTAHHADDNEEQILLRLISSGRLLDLSGIPEKRDQFLRPLLRISKSEITQYAQTHNLIWREDVSNSKLDYTRNKIRLQLKPLLTEIDPRNGKALQRFHSEIEQIKQESHTILQKHFGLNLKRGEFFVSDNFWIENLSVVKEILLEYWRKSNAQLNEIERFYKSSKVGSTLYFHDGQYVLREKNGLWFGHEQLDFFEEILVDLTHEFSVNQLENAVQVQFNDLQSQGKLPDLKYKSILVKKPQTGESVLLASGKSRKIKKIWNDEQWTHHDRIAFVGFYADEILICILPSKLLKK